MKKILLHYVAGMFLIALACFACTKEESAPPEETPTTTGTNKFGSFTYNVNSGATIISDSAVYYPKFTTIYSYKGGTVQTVEINLSDLVVGSYSVSSVTGNQVTYVTSGKTFTASSGQVNITTNSANKISGDFSCTVSGNTITSIGGKFSELGYR